MWINEYLFYFYYQEAAIREISEASATRGEEVQSLNRGLLEEIAKIDTPNRALEAYYAYQRRRISTYMPYERAVPKKRLDPTSAADMPASRMGEGYAGVALTVIEAMVANTRAFTALNVPNEGAIAGLADTDVVEVSCEIVDGRIQTDRIPPVPDAELALMTAVKAYERLAVRAIEKSSPSLATEALMSHPLVVSYPRARLLVNEYLQANRAFVGAWRD
jgi:6-phospho-beta-glucosidase